MKNPRCACILVMSALGLAQGCASTPLQYNLREQSVPALPAAVAAYYDYPAHTHQAVSLLIQKKAAYSEYLVRFPLSFPSDLDPTEPVVEIEWFETNRPGRQPAIVFNPILGGDYPIERNLCRALTAGGHP